MNNNQETINYNVWRLVGGRAEDDRVNEVEAPDLFVCSRPFCNRTPLIYRPDLGAGYPEVDRQSVWRCNNCLDLYVIKPIEHRT